MEEIRWLIIDEEKKEIDLSNLENPIKKWYKIAGVRADYFFRDLYTSNLTFFWKIEWIRYINGPNYLNNFYKYKAKHILKKYFQKEYK